MGTEGRIEKGHGDFTPDHRMLTIDLVVSLGTVSNAGAGSEVV